MKTHTMIRGDRMAVRKAVVALTALLLWGCAPVPGAAVPVASSTNTVIPTEEVKAPDGTPRASPYLAILARAQTSVQRYKPLELILETDLTTANPFDPELFEIRVRFTAPSGKEADVGAFWYQDFDLQSRIPEGDPGWRARFTPTEVGTWTASARAEPGSLESEPIQFEVADSDLPGFVRIHPEDPRYFAFDNGDFFFPIGLNMGWWGGASNAVTDYGHWMADFDANGGDLIRIWMAPWSFSIEWANTPLGDYSNRLKQAWLLDQVFHMAEERDLYIMLVLLTHCQYSEWHTCEWPDNPYKASHGGPLESPDAFASNPEARALFQRRLNYIVNRWGYSPNLLAWEWWNEVNLTAIPEDDLIPWLQEMTAYLRERDVNQHLLTNSYAIVAHSPTWALPEIEVVQRHEYADQIRSPDRDLAGRVSALYREQAAAYPGKPILLGEFGYGASNDADNVETTGIHLHNGLWATAFSGYAGSGMYWWWDVYVDRFNLWRHFRALDQFLADEDLTHYQPFASLTLLGENSSAPEAVGLGLVGDEMLIWMRSQGYTAQASIAARQANSLDSMAYLPPQVEGHTLRLEGLADGDYSVHWYDPQAGRWLEQETVTAENGLMLVPVPPFRKDLAAKISPLP